jgi:glucose dehydrogenase
MAQLLERGEQRIGIGPPRRVDVAEGEGDARVRLDHEHRALDKATGETVAEIELPGATGAKPMTYMLDGRQYIVVSIGQPGTAELIALALPD